METSENTSFGLSNIILFVGANLYLIILEFTIPLILAPRIDIHVACVHRHFECRCTLDALLLLMSQNNGICQENTSFAALSYRSKNKKKLYNS